MTDAITASFNEVPMTGTDAACSAFGPEVLAAVQNAGQGGDTAEAVEAVKRKYAELKPDLKVSIAAQLAVRKTEYEQEIAHLDADLAEKVAAIDRKYGELSLEERADKHVQKEYRDEVSGVKTVRLRSVRKAQGDYDRDVVLIKSQESVLCQAKNQLILRAKGRKGEGISLATAALNFKASFNPVKTLKDKNLWKTLVPWFILAVLFAVYAIACVTNNYTMNIDTILTSGIYVAIVAVGAVFIYSQGAFDMSLGNACLVCAAVGIMAYDATGSIVLTLFLSVGLGIILGIINAILANFLNLPVMVMTLTMQSILSAVYSTITANSGGYIEVTSIRGYGGMALKWAILILFIIFALVLFNYTKIGRRNKMIGANATCAKFSGISLMKAGIIAFAISGIGLGLCGFLYITQTGSVNTGTALTNVGLNVIIAINLGGMPTSGGPKSRISAAIVGGFFCTILDEIFAALGLSIWRYLVKGIVFLVATCITSMGGRPKRLA